MANPVLPIVRRPATGVALFGLQAVAYLVLVTNLRAIAHLHYPLAAVTEVLYLCIQWVVLRRIMAAETLGERVGYVLGGMVGTLLSMWLTRTWGG